MSFDREKSVVERAKICSTFYCIQNTLHMYSDGVSALVICRTYMRARADRWKGISMTVSLKPDIQMYYIIYIYIHALKYRILRQQVHTYFGTNSEVELSIKI